MKIKRKQTEMEKMDLAMEKLDSINKSFLKFIDGCTLLHPPTPEEQEEARKFHEQVREAWGFGEDY